MGHVWSELVVWHTSGPYKSRVCTNCNYSEGVFPVYYTKYLSDVMRGIYTKTTYWSDGSETKEEIPEGPIFIPPISITFYTEASNLVFMASKSL